MRAAPVSSAVSLPSVFAAPRGTQDTHPHVQSRRRRPRIACRATTATKVTPHIRDTIPAAQMIARDRGRDWSRRRSLHGGRVPSTRAESGPRGEKAGSINRVHVRGSARPHELPSAGAQLETGSLPDRPPSGSHKRRSRHAAWAIVRAEADQGAQHAVTKQLWRSRHFSSEQGLSK